MGRTTGFGARNRRARSGAAIAGVVVLAAVAGACGGDDDGSADLGDWCAEVEDGSVPTCVELHAEAPGLRLPTGTTVGVINRGGTAFVTADESYPMQPGDAAAVTEGFEPGEYATALYRAEVEDGKVAALTKVAEVSEDAVLTWTFGGRALEGTIGRLLTDGSYSLEPDLPVRVEFEAAASDGTLRGSIANATSAVLGSDGQCLPALSSAEGNPLVGDYTASIWVVRSPSMHVEFDDELVLHWTDSVSNMGADFYPSLATVSDRDPLGPSWSAVLHGNPTSGPPMLLELVDPGAGTAEPC